MKIIDKAVMNYYKRYIQDFIKSVCLERHINVKFKETKEGFITLIKEYNFKDELYTEIGFINKAKYIFYITHLVDLRKDLNRNIFEYRKLDYVYEDL